MLDVNQIVAAINPDIYCAKKDKDRNEIRKKVKELIKTKGYLEAAAVAKPITEDPTYEPFLDLDSAKHKKSAFNGEGLKKPIEQHELVYEVQQGSLEPIYFWILEYLNNNYEKSEKLADTFISSPGSSHFAEMGGRATRMQEEGMKLLGQANTVLKSILNIVYDLKEFKIRLEVYKDYKSEDRNKKRSALMSLKQIWMDSVDIKRGNSAIKAMAAQFDYVTLIDAFMAADSLEDVTKPADKGGLDLNERVRRILQQRVGEFQRWISESEKELSKRFEIEKTYLKAQVNALKLYSRWAKPYLMAAKKLEQQANPDTPYLVNAFNTSILELVLMGTKDDNAKQHVYEKDLPENMRNLIEDKKIRTCKYILLVSFKFIAMPDRANQQGGYGFKGRVELKMTSYALNDEELTLLRETIEKDDFGEIYKSITGATDDSLKQIEADIEEFLGEKPFTASDLNKGKEEKKKEDNNPFSSLFSFFKSEEKQTGKDKIIKPDSDYEKAIRDFAVIKGREECRKFYDAFKALYNMPRQKAFGPGA